MLAPILVAIGCDCSGTWGEVEPNRKHGQLQTVRGWRCRCDLETGKFDVPPIFARDNVEALARRSERAP